LNKDMYTHLYLALFLAASIASLIASASVTNAQGDEIVLENADFNSTSILQYPQDIPSILTSRIVVEYADYANLVELYQPYNMPNASLTRIVVEYADAAFQMNMLYPQSPAQSSVPRIIVEYADYSQTLDIFTYLGPHPMGKNDTEPPEISVLLRIPADLEVQEYQDVTVIADITDLDGGIKNATLQYNLNNGTEWFDVPMTLNMSGYKNSLSVSYYGVIPGQPQCTWVRFKVIAYDYAWNKASRDGESPYEPYHVIPELSSITLILLLIVSLLTISLAKHSFMKTNLI